MTDSRAPVDSSFLQSYRRGMLPRRAVWCLGMLAAGSAVVAIVSSTLGRDRPSARPQTSGGIAAFAAPDAAPPAGRTGDPYQLRRADALVRAAAHRKGMAVSAAATLAGIGRGSWSWLGPG